VKGSENLDQIYVSLTALLLQMT